MCITEEQVARVVDARLSINNEKRDENLQRKLDEQSEKFFAHTSKILEHNKTSPETSKELTNIKSTCSARGTDLALMNQKLNSIEEKIDNFLEKLEKLETEKADKEELNRIRRNIDWGVKLVLGAVILALIALVLKN